MKAAVVDGVAWLDDRNWAGSGSETVVRDSDPDDVAAVAAAVAGRPGADRHLATTKAGAQRLESAVIADAGSAPLARRERVVRQRRDLQRVAPPRARRRSRRV